MNNIDKALYKLFADKTLSEGCMYLYNWVPRRAPWNIVKIDKRIYKILWHEPQLHDVFKKAESISCNVKIDSKFNEIVFYWEDNYWENVNVMFCKYDSSLSLMNQKKRTKQAIVGLFS